MMAGRGPAPKPAATRQRVNRKAGAATLDAPVRVQVPVIPNPDRRKWHPLTEAWWKRVWHSPMAAEYLESDIDALGTLALLKDALNKNPDDLKLATEIRLQEARFGFTPVDRARLQWEVAKGDEAERKRKPQPAPKPKAGSDPRDVLRVVS